MPGLRFQVGSRVYQHGHGYGTVVEVRTAQPPNDALNYLMSSRGASAIGDNPELAQPAIVGGLVNSMYDAERYPYRVRFEPSEQYPDGYCDVYSPDDLYGNRGAYTRYINRWAAQRARERRERLAELRAAEIQPAAEELLTHPEVSGEEIAAAGADETARIRLIRRVRENGLVTNGYSLRVAAEAVDGAIAHAEAI